MLPLKKVMGDASSNFQLEANVDGYIKPHDACQCLSWTSQPWYRKESVRGQVSGFPGLLEDLAVVVAPEQQQSW